MCTCVTGPGLQRQKGLLLITTEILKKKEKKERVGGGALSAVRTRATALAGRGSLPTRRSATTLMMGGENDT